MKVVVKFKQGWGRYNAGEIAGFEAETAEGLVSGKRAVAELHGDGKPTQPGLDLDASKDAGGKSDRAAKAEATRRKKALDTREAELNTREAKLDELAESLAERSNSLDQHQADIEATLNDTTMSGDGQPLKPSAQDTAKGAPPAQGAAKK